MSQHNNSTSVSQERDYGMETGMLRRAPAATSNHPLEDSERNFHQRQEAARLSSASRTFGMGFAQHHRHQRAAAGCADIGHMGFLPKSSAHLQALTGRDLELDFADTLGIETEITRNPHLTMEKIQQRSIFRML